MLPRGEYLATLPRKRVIVSAFIRDAASRVLCVNPTYKTSWHLPGGSVESGESPSEGCRRECSEELGVDLAIGRLLAVGHLPPDAEDPDGAMAFLYEVSLNDLNLSSFSIPADELEGVCWLDRNQWEKKLSRLALQLVGAGWQAIESGTVAELDRSLVAIPLNGTDPPR